MTIRFHCPACHQPVEVDDADTGRQVVCFYCRAVVTATDRSDANLVPEGGATVVSAARVELHHISELDRSGAIERTRPSLARPAPTRQGNPLGTIGFLASLAAAVVVVAVAVWMAGQMAPMIGEPYFQKLRFENKMQLVQQHIDELARDRPGMFAATMWTILGLAVIGFVFSLAALAGHRRKGLAIIGLIISSIFLAGPCAGLLSRLQRTNGKLEGQGQNSYFERGAGSSADA